MTTSQSGEGALHRRYVEAINSNDVDHILALLSDDVVFQAPGEPELIGKDAIREWGNSFFEAFDAHWDKTELSFERSGDLAISRYIYSARYTGRDDNAVMEETGKGTCIYRRGEDGSWRLAIDSWSTNEAGAEG
ncbi:YybH family protein [Algimonas porphyrae]|uniref:SnoaL-like domain-containing protein n=1 Tax=Algimonas porphyrae TaxID=1128113 RepID=A0ABQ5V4E1_9PROT|nr:nuclear transport factor 2 family protein [Algimonas porphyrae]GLQ21955.1 hypothetical protein GCM10007854_29100 [Algimonas porphyrae]